MGLWLGICPAIKGLMYLLQTVLLVAVIADMPNKPPQKEFGMSLAAVVVFWAPGMTRQSKPLVLIPSFP